MLGKLLPDVVGPDFYLFLRNAQIVETSASENTAIGYPEEYDAVSNGWKYCNVVSAQNMGVDDIRLAWYDLAFEK